MENGAFKKKEDADVSCLGFDPEVVALLKEETGGTLELGEGFAEDGDEIDIDACVADVSRDKTKQALANIRAKLKPGYMAFVWKYRRGIGGRPDKIGVMKATDQFEYLRMVQTSAPNHSINNEKIVSTLKEWHSRYPFDIIGANNDWVEIIFENTPDNLLEFAGEVYKLCSDSVDQGTGTLEALAEEIRSKNRLFLWWD